MNLKSSGSSARERSMKSPYSWKMRFTFALRMLHVRKGEVKMGFFHLKQIRTCKKNCRCIKLLEKYVFAFLEVHVLWRKFSVTCLWERSKAQPNICGPFAHRTTHTIFEDL